MYLIKKNRVEDFLNNSCPHCGATGISAKANLCKYCGAQLRKLPPEIAAIVVSESERRTGKF